MRTFSSQTKRDTLYLRCTTRQSQPETARHDTVKYEIDLSKGIDEKDFPTGYAEEDFYFKAGAYGQCSVNDSHPIWGPGCAGTGDFATDKKNGDYNSVTFSALKLNGK